MKYKIVTILIIILNSPVNCQDENLILERISQKFKSYCELFPREEVYVGTDRDFYIAGEELWFSSWLFDRQTESLSTGSKIIYFEILNPVNRPIVQKRIGLEKGTGSGRAVLPDTLSSGIYTLRAYTNWMKNFMPHNCFTKRFNVYSVSGNRNILIPEENRSAGINHTASVNGISIIVSSHNKDYVEAAIIVNNDYRKKNNNISYLFIQTHGLINYKSVVSLKDDTTRIEIPASTIVHGINQYTIFDSSGTPACETYSYTPQTNSDLLHVNIIAPDSCRSREQLSIGLEVDENVSPGDTVLMSISVVPTGTKSSAGIKDYLVFGSEFGQLPEVFIEKNLDNIPDSAINDFLLTAESNWIDWDLILSDNMPVIKYQKEMRFHYLDGSTFNSFENNTSVKHNIFLSVPGKNATLQYSGIRRDGSFEFCLPVDNKIRDLIIQADEELENNKIIIRSSFSDRYPELIRGYSETPPLPVVQELAQNYRVMRIYRSFEPRVERSQEILSGGTRSFYGKPDVELKMADYIPLPTIQEIFFELVPGVAVRSDKNGYQITIRDPSDSRILDDPLLLIDGVVIRDPDIFAGIDPQFVEKIDIIKSKYAFGDCIFSGLINIITAKNDIGNVSLPVDATRMLYRVFEPQEKFAFPDHSLPETRQNHVPDFRNTLYWETLSISGLSKKVTRVLSASDFISDYDIIIQGVTMDGRFVSQRKPIRIRK